MNKFEKEQGMALIVGDDLSRSCHSDPKPSKLISPKLIKIRKETTEDREVRLQGLGFEPISEEQKAYNLLCFDLYR